MSAGTGTGKVVTLSIGALSRSRGKATSSAPPVSYSCQWGAGGPGRFEQGLAGDAQLTLSATPEDAEAMWRGELAPSVAFMQGRLKASGDNALLLEVLRWTATDAYERVRAQLLEGAALGQPS